jgi:hypothetical protein
LDTLKKERDRLKKKKVKTPSDERRLVTIDQQLRAGERDNQRAIAKTAGRRAAARFSPWDAKTRAVSMAQRIPEGRHGAWGTSAGQKMKRDQLRQSFGMAALADMGMVVGVEDAAGNVSMEVAPEWEGVRFGPGVGGPTGQRAGSSIKGRDLTTMTGMSVKDVMDFYYSLNDDELSAIQHQLMQAGLIEGRPSFGFRDNPTTEALGKLMLIWADRPDQGIQDVLKSLRAQNAGALDEATRKMLDDSVTGAGALADQVANISVTPTETLDSTIDALSVELFGRLIDPERKTALISKLQEQERAAQVGQAQTSFGIEKDIADREAAKSGGSELERFMEALIQQESGGDPNAVNSYSGARGLGQFMYWDEWAREAGRDPGDFSAGNQKEVIRYKLAQYYQEYGNWRDVAIAWYGGAGGVQRARAGGGNSGEGGGHPSLNQYADSLLASMGQITDQKIATGGAGPQLIINEQQEMASAQDRARQELKAIDPARYAGTKFAERAAMLHRISRGVV